MKIARNLKRIVKMVSPHGALVFYNLYLNKSPNNPYIIAKREAEIANNVAFVSSFNLQDNKYIELMTRAVKKAGYKVVDDPGDAKYIWLHWFENKVTPGNFYTRILSIEGWQKRGKKVIFHIHNKKPHEHADDDLANSFITTGIYKSNHVTIMSSETLGILKNAWHWTNDKTRITGVPHPNYIGEYGDKVGDGSLDNKTLNILFFGLVRPYKGLEHLIAATSDMSNVRISICGAPLNDVYRAEIEAMCQNRKDIVLQLRHIEDKEIPELFARHHIVAAPHSLDSSLNSGTAILALSYARTIVGTSNGTLKEIDDDLYFSYSYSNEKDHTEQLRKAIMSIQKRYNGKYRELLDIGELGYEFVKANNNLEVVAKAIGVMLRKV